MNPVAVLLLHQRQQRRSSASLSMWPAIPEPCRHRNIASSAGPWRRGHATPHKRLSCLVFHNELHELDELSPLEKVLNHGLHGLHELHEFFILHSSRQSSRIRVIRCFYNTPRNCFLQRITRIRRISLFTFILHSSFFIWRSAPSFFTSEDKNSSNSCNFPILIQRLWGCPVGGRANRCGNRR